mgnify:CR=1 FL=1
MADSILDRFKEVFDPEEAKAAGRKLKVAIIGCGWIAEAHVKSYLKCEDVDIVAAADLIPGKAEAFFKKMGVKNLPSIYINGKLKFSSLIPSANELDAAIQEAM